MGPLARQRREREWGSGQPCLAMVLTGPFGAVTTPPSAEKARSVAGNGPAASDRFLAPPSDGRTVKQMT